MPTSKKIEFLSQEIFRRLHNTKKEMHDTEIPRIMNKFMLELKMSGYSNYDRFQILKSGFSNYQKLRDKENIGMRPFYRSKHFEKAKRKDAKLESNIMWYKNKLSSSESTFTSVFFVPSTPGGKLLKMLRETEKMHQIGSKNRIKFIETSGRKYIDHLKIKDPFSENCKSDTKCFACQDSDKQTNCKVSNVGYKIVCQTCKDRHIDRTYEGETCRSAHLRGNEHLRDLEKKNERSVLLRHIKADHSDEETKVKFKMEIVGRFKTAMNRQINEGIRIQGKDPKTLMNSKTEFYGPAIHKKVLEGKRANNT